MPSPLALIKQVKESRRQPGAALFEVLATRALAERDNKRVVTQADIFQAFASTGFDYVGQVSTGYSAYGLKVGVDVGLDAGALFAPGFVTLEVKAGLAGEGTKNLLLVLARQPASIETNTPGQIKLTKSRTCCLMAMRGAAWTASVSASGTAGVKVGVTSTAKKAADHNLKSHSELAAEKAAAATRSLGQMAGDTALECIGVGAGASATGVLSASYSGTYLYLCDQYPTFHASWRDQSIVDRFNECVGPGEKAMIKSRMLALFKDLPALWTDAPSLSWYEHISKGITGGRIDFARIKLGLDKAKATLQRAEMLTGTKAASMLFEIERCLREADEQMNRGYFSRMGDSGKAELKTKMKLLFANQALSAYRPDARGVGSEVKLSRWKTALQEAKSLLSLSLSAAKRKELADEIEHHLATIQAFREYDRASGSAGLVSTGDDDVFYTGLCHLRLWGHSPEIGAQAQAQVQLNALTALAAEATATASAKKSWKWTHYRFQQFMPSDGGATDGCLPCVISTQDTSITYSQTVLAAGVTASLPVLGEQKSPTLGKSYNALSYESAHVYWSHPAAPDAFGKAKTVAMPGSGYTIGQSVTLTTLAEHARASAPESRKYREVVAAALDVTDAQLDEFLAQSWVLDALDFIPQEAVLLEATFAAAGVELDVEFEAGKPQRPRLDKDARNKIVAHGRTSARANLESIRIRYRIADDKECRTPFKLGIPAGPVKLGIQLEAVTKAGALGIVDLECYWFNDKSRNTDPLKSAVRDDTVPPVALFHQ